MKTTYDDLRTSPNLIDQVRQYYKRKARDERKKSMPWWLESDTRINLQLWSSISKIEKELLQSKMCILFPEILKKQKDKYARVALWLCAKYSILLYNTRDCFSAGGQCLKINGKKLGFKVSQVVARYLNLAKNIKRLFQDSLSLKEEILEFNPEIWNDDANRLYNNWLNQIDILMQSQFCSDTRGVECVKNIPFIEWFEEEYVLE